MFVYVNICIFVSACLCVYVLMCTGSHGGQKRMLDRLELVLQDFSEAQHGCLELNWIVCFSGFSIGVITAP